MTRYGSRKFITAMSALACAQWALFERLISGQDWKTVVIAIVALYGGANVAQRAVEKLKQAAGGAQ